MKIEVQADIGNGEAWFKEWHAKRNAAVAALAVSESRTGELSREEHDDEQARRVFCQLARPKSERSRSERETSPDARLYEDLTMCMTAARRDERRRIAKAISQGLQTLLGDEFWGIMWDIAEDNDINIGRD